MIECLEIAIMSVGFLEKIFMQYACVKVSMVSMSGKLDYRALLYWAVIIVTNQLCDVAYS